MLHTLATLIFGIAVMAIATSDLHVPLDLVTWGFGIGYLSHLIGDMATKEGAPLLLPFTKTRFKYANFTTGQFFERYVASTLLAGVITFELYLLIGGPNPFIGVVQLPAGGVTELATRTLAAVRGALGL